MTETVAPPPVHADGVYLDLPMQDYVRDRALSASAFMRLNTNPPDYDWEHVGNPLWSEPQSDARDLGSLAHCAILEGLGSYDAQFSTLPRRDAHPAAIETSSDMAAWLKGRNEALSAAALIDTATGKPARLNISGSKPDQWARIVEHCKAFDLEPPTLWEAIVERHVRGRAVIKRDEDIQVRLVEKFLRSDPVYAKLLSDGLPEVSIFWTEDDIRYKARIDWLRQSAIVDVKTFGRSYGRGLLRGFLADRIAHGDDMQAVHAARAVDQMARLPHIHGGAQSRPAADIVNEMAILDRIAEGEKVFVWLGVRIGGAPTALAPRFDKGTIVWAAAEQKIAAAVERYREYRANFGTDMWIRSLGLVEPDISDWPIYATELPA